MSAVGRARIDVDLFAQRIGRRGHRLTGRYGPRGLILIYHRVTTPGLDPWELAVSPQHFAEQLEVLRRAYAPTHLRSLRAALGAPRVPVALTFDDGFADNLLNALPILERLDTPATIFVVPGIVNSEREFWWDELERFVFERDDLPARLTMQVAGRTTAWDVPPLDDGRAAGHGDGRWRGWEPPPTPRHALYIELWRTLQAAQPDEREPAIESLWQNVGARPVARESHRGVTDAELAELGASPCIEIGAHTLSHVRLSSLSAAGQRAEIAGSKRWLEERLGRRVNTFSYPHGGPGDFTSRTAELVREAGFRLAFTTYPGLVRRWSNHFLLPRVLVGDWDGDEFERRMRDWLPG